MRRCLRCSGHFAGPDWRCPSCGWQPAESEGVLLFSPESAHASSGFYPEAYAQLFDLECGNFWFRARNALIGAMLGKYFPNATSVLEVGCGTGYVLSEIERTYPAAQITGTEQLLAALTFARRRLQRSTLHQMDALALPFAEEFDLVCAFDVLEHIEQHELALRELRRALRPNGGVVLTVPQHMFLWSQADVYAHHKRRYARRELLQLLKNEGIELLRVTSFVSTVLPLLLISRLRSRSVESYEPEAEFRISRWLNKTLELFLGFERLCIRHGISFPAGGSLLVVARKPG